MKNYRVKQWNEFFESAKSREYDHRSQCYMPNKHGLGYQYILALPNGGELFGCWCALIQVLSRQSKPRHGYLTDTGKASGRLYTAKDISLLTCFKESICGLMLETCLTQPIEWLEVYEREGYSTDTTQIPQSPYPSPLPSPSPLPLPLKNPKKDSSSSDKRTRKANLTDDEFWKAMSEKFSWVDVSKERSKMEAWLLTPQGRGRHITRRFVVNWLCKTDKPMPTQQGETHGSKYDWSKIGTT